jgi:transcriptional regulator with XRE-family HTH domain
MRPPEDPRRHFADKVARLQARRGLSNEDLAIRAKLDLDQLEEILRGEGGVDAAVILLVAGALKVEPRELLEGLAWIPDEAGGGGGYRVEADGED